MVRPLGPATAAPVACNCDDIRVAFFCVALIVLFFLALAIHRCCYCRRSRDEPPAAAVSASQHLQVDEISITIYAKGGTDDYGGGNNSESCAICLQDFVAGEELRVLPPCKHTFHKNCVDPWLLAGSKSTYPLCREPVVVARPTSDRDYNSDSGDNTDDVFPTVDSLMIFYGLHGDDDSHSAPLTTTVDDKISVSVSEIYIINFVEHAYM